MDTQRLSQTVQPLLDWFQAHARTLPWRADREPYHVWLSEIMLQQTRVEAVRGYYARFLAAAPDVFALAALPEEDREIFYRFYDLSQTNAQIADELHMNASTVRSRLLRGREALRKTLTKGGLFCEDDVG